MKYIAFKTFQYAKKNPIGLPLDWPWKIQKIGISQSPPDQSGEWTILDEDSFNTYVGDREAVAKQLIDTFEAQKILNKAWERVRNRRNKLLSESDWTQLPDNTLLTVEKDQWATYRQSLRDITDSSADPENIVWPNKP